MKNLGFIPVRGGSKRLPQKNLKKLGDKSITHRVIDEALASEMFTDLIVSTDDTQIIDHCQKYKDRIIIDKRDPSLAKDTSTVLEVAIEMIGRLEQKQRYYDTFTIMLATCPFRQARHIVEGFKLYEEGLNSVISVTEFDFPWESSLIYNDEGDMVPAVDPSPFLTKKTRSQDRKKVYHPNGGFFLLNWQKFKKNKNFYKGRVKAYEMDKVHSIDIDTMYDFYIAEKILEGEWI